MKQDAILRWRPGPTAPLRPPEPLSFVFQREGTRTLTTGVTNVTSLIGSPRGPRSDRRKRPDPHRRPICLL